MTDIADREPAAPGPAVVVEDPRAIRALAHPARLAILEHLGTGVTATATECARVCGLSAAWSWASRIRAGSTGSAACSASS